MKVYHEHPIGIYDLVSSVTDGDYALVHLMTSNIPYRNMIKRASLELGREIILDNSIFELGESCSNHTLVDVIRDIKPTWYIVPDVLEDADATISKFDKFFSEYNINRLESKPIAVLQGKDHLDMLRCFDHFAPTVTVVAIPYDSSYWCEGVVGAGNILQSLAVGRVRFVRMLIERMKRSGVHRRIHLLGCSLPQEMLMLRSALSDEDMARFMNSVDTSNPIIHGMHGVEYDGDRGLAVKISTKLCDLVDHVCNEKEITYIKHNLKCFAYMVGGEERYEMVCNVLALR